jgi:hypothetical protein
MADISKLSRLIGGAQRQVDLSSNALVVGSIKVGGVSNTELTKAILDNLVALQNGTDFANGTNAHTHDGRYFTETELSSTSASSGSDLIGDDNTYSNFTPSSATLKGALTGIDSALATAGATSFSDALFEIYDDGDATKKIVFQASGIATATTRTVSLTQNANLDLIATAIQRDGSVAFTANQPMGGFKFTGLAAGSGAGDSVRYEQAILASGANAWTANQSLGGFKITNAADGTSAQDYVTKAQLDAVSVGLDPKASVRASTTAALPAVTYDNGASGVGATLTADANGALATQDGVTLVVGNRFLVKNQVAALQNGIYIVTAVGDGSNPFILTRATDQDGSPASEVSGGNFTFVEAGTTQAGSGWTVLWDGNVVVGTDAISWTKFSDTTMIGGDMITLTGNTVSVDLASTSGLESSNSGNAAGQLRVKLEASNPSLQITGSNELAAKLDAAGAILSGASGLAVQTDNSSIEINTNTLRVKAAGITESHLAASVAGAGLTGGAGSALSVGAGDGITVNANDVAVNVTALIGSGIENDGSNNFRIAAAAYDQNTITGGAGSAAAVQHAPKIQEAKVAGEAFAATTLFAVRYAKAADAGFVAGRMYKAAIDASSADNFYVIGLTRPASLLAAGDPLTIVKHGTINVPTHGFTVGAPLFLDASGVATETAPSATNMAVVRLGIVIDANNIDVQIQVMGIN